jgi:immune inhibitor A
MKKGSLKVWFFGTFVVLFVVFGIMAGAMAMPPHSDILEKYHEIINAHPELSPSVLRTRGIDTPATLPDGTPVFEYGKGPTGTFRALALLVKFTDNPSSVGASFFDTLIFGTGTGTVRDYYREISYSTLDIVTVNLPSSLNWKTAPQTYTYYVNGNYGFGSYPRNAQKLVEDVVALVNPVVDFSQYDNNGDNYVDALFVIHAGPGAEYTGDPNDIWSHKWNTSYPLSVDGVYVYTYSMEPEYWATPGDMTIGVYAHELGHVFGLPDWYDYGYDSEGIGDWGLMASGSWNGYLGNSPAHISAEGKRRLGFITPTVITSNVFGLSVPQVETNQTNSVFYVWNDGIGNNEYFLIENRQKVGYDSALPGSGILIWHVDKNMSGNDYQCTDHDNCNCTLHYEVALEQADGDLDLEFNSNDGDTGDPFPGTTNQTTFNLITIPNSGSYADCSSCVEIFNISSSGPTMSIDVNVECGSIGILPDIKANGSDGPVTIHTTDSLILTLSLDPGSYGGNMADWWLLVKTPLSYPNDWYYYDLNGNAWRKGKKVTHQGTLFNLSPYDITIDPGLPAGSYIFYFGVDTIMNGSIDMGELYYDSVNVDVIP